METIFNDKIVDRVRINNNHAKIITIEGIDGAGKTTIVNNLIKEIANLGYKVEHFNTSSLYNIYWDTVKSGINKGIIDKDVNQLLHNLAFLTYIKTIFIDKLNKNDFVISEWYIYGKMVLSELYSGKEECISKKILQNELEEGNIVLPNYSFYLEIDPNIAYKRILSRNGDMEEKEKIEMLIKASDIWERYVQLYDIIRLDASSSVEDICKRVLKRVFRQNEK